MRLWQKHSILVDLQPSMIWQQYRHRATKYSLLDSSASIAHYTSAVWLPGRSCDHSVHCAQKDQRLNLYRPKWPLEMDSDALHKPVWSSSERIKNPHCRSIH